MIIEVSGPLIIDHAWLWTKFCLLLLEIWSSLMFILLGCIWMLFNVLCVLYFSQCLICFRKWILCFLCFFFFSFSSPSDCASKVSLSLLFYICIYCFYLVFFIIIDVLFSNEVSFNVSIGFWSLNELFQRI